MILHQQRAQNDTQNRRSKHYYMIDSLVWRTRMRRLHLKCKFLFMIGFALVRYHWDICVVPNSLFVTLITWTSIIQSNQNRNHLKCCCVLHNSLHNSQILNFLFAVQWDLQSSTEIELLARNARNPIKTGVMVDFEPISQSHGLQANLLISRLNKNAIFSHFQKKLSNISGLCNVSVLFLLLLLDGLTNPENSDYRPDSNWCHPNQKSNSSKTWHERW